MPNERIIKCHSCALSFKLLPTARDGVADPCDDVSVVTVCLYESGNIPSIKERLLNFFFVFDKSSAQSCSFFFVAQSSSSEDWMRFSASLLVHVRSSSHSGKSVLVLYSSASRFSTRLSMLSFWTVKALSCPCNLELESDISSTFGVQSADIPLRLK